MLFPDMFEPLKEQPERIVELQVVLDAFLGGDQRMAQFDGFVAWYILNQRRKCRIRLLERVLRQSSERLQFSQCRETRFRAGGPSPTVDARHDLANKQQGWQLHDKSVDRIGDPHRYRTTRVDCGVNVRQTIRAERGLPQGSTHDGQESLGLQRVIAM